MLEPMTSPGWTRSEATESDCHREVLIVRGRDQNPPVSLRRTLPYRRHTNEYVIKISSAKRRERSDRVLSGFSVRNTQQALGDSVFALRAASGIRGHRSGCFSCVFWRIMTQIGGSSDERLIPAQTSLEAVKIMSDRVRPRRFCRSFRSKDET